MGWQQLIILAVVIGAVLYVLQLLPIQETFKKICMVLAIVIFAVFALRFLFALI